MRIRLEADAVQLILSHVRAGNLILVTSPVHEIEIGAIEDRAEREHLLWMLRELSRPAPFDAAQVRQRAEQLAQQGLGPADAAHLACAEAAGADFHLRRSLAPPMPARSPKHLVWHANGLL
jgi:predicted nucleic acid-binding protein